VASCKEVESWFKKYYSGTRQPNQVGASSMAFPLSVDDREFGPQVRVQPNDVVTGNQVIGRAPDLFIRDQLLREYNSGRGN